jgi:hypothetical protein
MSLPELRRSWVLEALPHNPGFPILHLVFLKFTQARCSMPQGIHICL